MLEVEISLQYPSARFARSIMQALSPDNELADRQMHVSSSVTGQSLRVCVEDCSRIETLQVTLQDIFRCIRAAESSVAKLANSR